MRQLVTALMMLVATALAAAAQLPQWQHTSINDFAGVLTADDTRRLDQALIDVHDRTGTEGTVVTIPGLAAYGEPGSVESFATRLFNAWGVGDAARDDGFMVLLSTGDRTARIEVGRGYPPEAGLIAQQIIDRVMLPELRAGNLSGGLRAGTLAVSDRIARPRGAGDQLTAPGDRGALPALVLFGAGVAVMLGLARRNRRRRDRCPTCGQGGLVGVVVAGAPSRRCPSCGWTGTAPRPGLWRDRPDRHHRGGGSSGFGGGSSSGGGASGRW